MKFEKKHLLIVWCAVIALMGICTVNAAEGARGLILVDTSFSMARQKSAVTNVLFQLVASGLEGQLRPGARLEIWTFNDQIDRKSFPESIWQPAESQPLAARAVDFLRKRRFEKRTRLDLALPIMLREFEGPHDLVMCLISDGEGEFRGTPFDRTLNDLYRLHGPSMRRMRQPFVSYFKGKDGRLSEWAVHAGTALVQNSPPAEKPAQSVTATNPENASPQSPANPKSEAVLQTLPKTETAKPQEEVKQPALNRPAAPTASAPESSAKSTAQPKPTPIQNQSVSSNPTPAQPAAVVASNESKAPAPPSIVEQKAPAPSEPVPTLPAPTPQPEQIPQKPPSTLIAQPVERPFEPPQPTASATALNNSADGDAERPPTDPAAVPAVGPQPLPVVLDETKTSKQEQPVAGEGIEASNLKKTEVAEIAKPVDPTGSVALQAGHAVAPAVVALAPAPPAASDSWKLTALAVLLAILAMLLLVWYRKTTRPQQPSLISRSMDRPGK